MTHHAQSRPIPPVSSLSPREQDRLNALLHARGLMPLTSSRIRKLDAQAPRLPSFEQERLLFLQQLDPTKSHYNLPLAVRVRGPLSVPAWEGAVNRVIARHDALRTVFKETDGMTLQVIVPPVARDLPVLDLSDPSQPHLQAAVSQHVAHDVCRPFDLERGPLLRALLLRLSADEHVFVLSMHHTIGDAWSLEIIAQEMSACYNAIIEGREAPLEEPALQYADYAAWQRTLMSGETLEAELDYWRTQLANAPVLELPTVRSRPAVQSHDGATCRCSIHDSTSTAVSDLARREGVTLFMFMLAAFSALLSRECGQTDVVIGSPISGRTHPDLESVVGFLLNTAALRVDVSGNPTFRELLHRAREVALGAYAHQNAPFEELVAEQHPERDLSRTPLFQVLLVVEHAPGERWQLTNLQASPEPVNTGTAKFDLTLSVRERHPTMEAAWEYSLDLFDEPYVRRLAARFSMLLEQVTADPERRIEALTLLSAAERRQVVDTWNATTRRDPAPRAVHTLVEAQVARTPEAIAVVEADRQLTYRALNARANQLARHLVALGGAGGRVGICLPRALDLIVAVLAALKAGAAYVPLDPAYPDARLQFMLADAAVTVLVTDTTVHRGGDGGGGRPVVYVDAERDRVARYAPADLGIAGHVDDLLYIIYTSGSTGTPKGIALPHRALANLLAWHWATLRPAATTLQYASVSFDASAHELFATLGSGGRLVLMAEDGRRDMAALTGLVETHAVEKLILPGVVLDHLAQEANRRGLALPTLHELIATGEPLHITPDLRDFFRRRGGTLHNHYGPSETHVVTALTLTGPPPAWPAQPTIGSPIANTQIYVLDAHAQPTPVGVAGELYVGGASLARGYWRQPALTALCFVPAGVTGPAGARLYRTGDRARWRPDGTLEFLGRRDAQVKIRGYRVELGEIEAVLRQQPGVAQAAVTVTAAGADETRLTAYVVRQAGAAISTAALRTALQAHLPEPMVPAAIRWLPALPLTANGKVARQLLPAAPDPDPAPATAYVAPRTATEDLLARLWAEVLGVARVGIRDNFFELGGHSLLAMRVVNRLRTAFQRSVPLKALFQFPTVRQLAEAIDDLVTHGERLDVRVAKAASRTDLPVTVNQEKVLLAEECMRRHGIQPPPFNTPMALGLDGDLDTDRLESALNAIIRRHEILRAVFVPVRDISDTERGRRLFEFMRTETFAPGLFRHSILPEATLHVRTESIDHVDDGERSHALRAIAAREFAATFDYQKPPLIRALLVRVDRDRHVLFLVLPHLISDGRSLEHLQREIGQLYHALVEQRPNPLPDLSHHLSDFAVWQHQYLNSAAAESAFQYWAQQWSQFAQARLTFKDFNARPPQTPGQPGAAGVEMVTLAPPDAEPLRRFAQESSVTLYMLFLTTLYIALHELTGRTKIALWANFSNRGRAEFEPVVGWFVNSHLLGADLTSDPSPRALLTRLQTTVLDAAHHQELPLATLWRRLGHPPPRPPANRALNEAPIFFSFGSLHAAPDAAVPAPPALVIRELSPADVLSSLSTSKAMDVSIVEAGANIRLQLLYNAAAFAAPVMRGLAERWAAISVHVPEYADLPITRLRAAPHSSRRL